MHRHHHRRGREDATPESGERATTRVQLEMPPQAMERLTRLKEKTPSYSVVAIRWGIISFSLQEDEQLLGSVLYQDIWRLLNQRFVDLLLDLWKRCIFRHRYHYVGFLKVCGRFLLLAFVFLIGHMSSPTNLGEYAIMLDLYEVSQAKTSSLTDFFYSSAFQSRYLSWILPG